jgi:hypothetical protein
LSNSSDKNTNFAGKNIEFTVKNQSNQLRKKRAGVTRQGAHYGGEMIWRDEVKKEFGESPAKILSES